MFLIILRYKKALTEVDRFVLEHREFLARHYASGHFIVSGRKEPRDGGVILAKAGAKSEIEDIVRRDPFHRERIAEYDIVEFLPSMTATGFENLKEI